jgi:multidrug transporter EmrE-like cation transporter
VIGWLFLVLAVIANVAANLALKQGVNRIVRDGAGGSTLDHVRLALVEPWLWLGGLFAATLLGCYLIALARLPLTLTYTTVTISAMVSIAFAAHVLQGEPFGMTKAAGLALASAGILLLALGARTS